MPDKKQKRLNLVVDPDLHRHLKAQAALEEVEMGKLVESLIRDYLKSKGVRLRKRG